MKETKAALFDLDGTLHDEITATDAAIAKTTRGIIPRTAHARIGAEVRRAAGEEWAPIRARFAPLSARVGIGLSNLILGPFDRDARMATPELTRQTRELIEMLPDYRLAVWKRAFSRLGISITDAHARELSVIAVANRWRPGAGALVPGAVETLSGLRNRGVKIALVTDGNPSVQAAKTRQLGIDPFLDAVVVSGDVGVRKPSPTPSWCALAEVGVVEGIDAREIETIRGGRNIGDDLGRRLREAASSAWMVGDRLDTDLQGAAVAGIPPARRLLVTKFAIDPVEPVEGLQYVRGSLGDLLRRIDCTVDTPTHDSLGRSATREAPGYT